MEKNKSPISPPEQAKKQVNGPSLAQVSVRAGINAQVAQDVLYQVSAIPQTGAWAQQVKLGKKEYVVGMDKTRHYVVVLPLPFKGDDINRGYNIVSDFTTLGAFKKQLMTL